MAGYSIIFSPTGGTKKAADILCGAMWSAWDELDLCCDIHPVSFSEEDFCVVAVPSYGGRVPETAINRLKRLEGKGAKAVLLCVYGNRAWEDTLTELQDTLEQQGFVCMAAVSAVAEHSIFRQFGAGRPDKDDEAELKAFGEKIKAKFDAGCFEMPCLEGAHGSYKEFKGSAMKPQGNDNCGGCGTCAESCPVKAIDKANPRSTDKEICISCMRCVSVCPRHARDFDPAFMAEKAAAMAERLGGHKENFLFI